MRHILLYLFILLSVNALSQDNNQIQEKNLNEGKWMLFYDSNVLRVPGNEFRFGIIEMKENGNLEQTRGFLNGKVNWNKFRIEVKGATYRKGELRIPESFMQFNDTAMVVKVYKANSTELLITKVIPYHYESKIRFLTNGPIGKVPGSIIKYGFRLTYNNGSFLDYYPAKAKRRSNWFRIDSSEIGQKTKLDKPLEQFIISADGGYFLKRYLVVETDPFKIKHHTARFMVSLAQNPKISDTLETKLDYIDDYTFDSRFVRNYCISKNDDNEDHLNNLITYSSGYYGDQGHNLDVYAEIYHDSFFKDSLLLVVVNDLTNCEHYNYLVNTNGGSIKIYSHGLHGSDGADGANGSDGISGSDGSAGSIGSTTTKNITNNDGTTTTTTETGPGGDGGNGSNGSDGGRGGDGSNGNDGGNGGDIYFRYRSDVVPFLHMIDIRSIPGEGGSGGKAGSGGNGGKGGQGGTGGYGNPSGRNGSSGNNGQNGSNGNDGFSGNAGKPGTVIEKIIK